MKKLRILSLQVTPVYVWDHGDDEGLELLPVSEQAVVIPLKEMQKYVAELPEMVKSIETQLLIRESQEQSDVKE